jgi:hypothetical protein
MPNHVHGVVFIRAGLNPARKRLEE